MSVALWTQFRTRPSAQRERDSSEQRFSLPVHGRWQIKGCVLIRLDCPPPLAPSGCLGSPVSSLFMRGTLCVQHLSLITRTSAVKATLRGHGP